MRTLAIYESPQIYPLGDTVFCIAWTHLEPAAAFQQVQQAFQQLQSVPLQAQRELVPGFASLTIHFDPLLDCPLREEIEQHLHSAAEQPIPEARLVTIPVCYDLEYAFDLPEIARIHQLEISAVIELHCSAEYRVQMIGFTPGFPYLAGLPAMLATPRRAEPRLHLPAGSVAIGGEQTGIYPVASPGGWQIIGRTPMGLFFPDRDPPTRLQPGDRVRFEPISRNSFGSWQG